MDEAPIYLFDGDCVLCSRGVHYVLKYEKTPDVQFVAIQSKQGQKLALENDIDPLNPHTFLFIKDGTVLALSDAVFALTRHIGGPARLLLPAAYVPRPIRDFFYRLIAKNRYRLFGKLPSCYVPAPEERHRFVMN